MTKKQVIFIFGELSALICSTAIDKPAFARPIWIVWS